MIVLTDFASSHIAFSVSLQAGALYSIIHNPEPIERILFLLVSLLSIVPVIGFVNYGDYDFITMCVVAAGTLTVLVIHLLLMGSINIPSVFILIASQLTINFFKKRKCTQHVWFLLWICVFAISIIFGNIDIMLLTCSIYFVGFMGMSNGSAIYGHALKHLAFFIITAQHYFFAYFNMNVLPKYNNVVIIIIVHLILVMGTVTHYYDVFSNHSIEFFVNIIQLIALRSDAVLWNSWATIFLKTSLLVNIVLLQLGMNNRLFDDVQIQHRNNEISRVIGPVSILLFISVYASDHYDNTNIFIGIIILWLVYTAYLYGYVQIQTDKRAV
jgi:hypothetical protein